MKFGIASLLHVNVQEVSHGIPADHIARMIVTQLMVNIGIASLLHVNAQVIHGICLHGADLHVLMNVILQMVKSILLNAHNVNVNTQVLLVLVVRHGMVLLILANAQRVNITILVLRHVLTDVVPVMDWHMILVLKVVNVAI